MHSVGLSPYLLILNLGFLPVDGFFVLTGFLIAYPLLKEEARRVKVLAEKEKLGETSDEKKSSVESSSPWTFDLSTFYYRRVTRMLPSYILAVYFHCGLLFPGGVQHSMSIVRSNSFRNFIERVLPGIENAPNSCTPAKLFTNFTWMNHLMPFGGCMGWTWSFALQFNFYLFFPLLWKWAHKRASKGKISSVNTPSSRVLPFLWFFLLASIVVRIITFFQLRLFDLRHEEGVFLGFFWYSNTVTRGAAIVWGVLVAYCCTHTRLVEKLKTSLSWLIPIGWLILLVTVLLQMFWNRIFSIGNMVETPGWTALEQTQKLGGPESLQSMWSNTNLQAYWWHALFHIFMLVGSPMSNLIFVFLLIVIVHGIGRIGRTLQSLLSWSIWFPISTLSWWVYLVHPAIMTRFYSYYVEHIGELPATVEGLFADVGIQYVLSFGTALVAYVFIESPLEIILRQGEAAQQAQQQPIDQTKSVHAPSSSSSSSPSVASKSSWSFYTILRKAIFIYCIFCMIYIVLHHLAMYFAITQLEPKPYVDLPNALPNHWHQHANESK